MMLKAKSLLLAGLITGCTTAALQELQQTEPVESLFHRTLAAHYLSFAEHEAELYDWADSQHFARKGLIYAYGNMAEPEQPDAWDIQGPARDELLEARTALIAWMTDEKMSLYPELIADAQFYYDCWVEEKEEKWQDNAISACREQFATAMDMLAEAEAKAQEPVAETGDVAESTPIATPELPEVQFQSSTYIVFFDLGSSTLTKEARNTLQNVMTNLKDISSYDIIINGHTDRLGSAEYNLQLALKRAEQVKKMLVGEGVEKEQINVFSFGESDPRVPTADNIAEPANRRVEIYVTG